MRMETEQYKICFQGASLDVGNRGCRALAASFIKLALKNRPKARLNLLYGNREGGKRRVQIAGESVELNIVNCRLSPKARISEHCLWILLLACIQRILPIGRVRDKIVRSNRWLSTLKEADFVGEIRGGDSFSDIYGMKRFVIGLLPCAVAILMRKKLVLLPQTYGPFKSNLAKRIAKFVLLRSHRVFSRDTESIEVIRQVLGPGGSRKAVDFCPDIAFYLEPVLSSEPNIHPPLDRTAAPVLVGLNISGLLCVGGFSRDNQFGLRFDYEMFSHTLLNWFMEKTNAHVLLIPHVVSSGIEGEDELFICQKLQRAQDFRYEERVHVVMQEYDQNEIKGIIGLCDFFIGARMHACIAALSQGIPTIGLAYSRKFRGVFESVGANEFTIDMRDKGDEEILQLISIAFAKRHTSAGYLKSIMPGVKEQIETVFRSMF